MFPYARKRWLGGAVTVTVLTLYPLLPGTAARADTGTVSWYSYGGGSAVAAASAQALLQGNGIGEAKSVAAHLSGATDGDTEHWIQQVLNNADPSSQQATVDALLRHHAGGAPDAVGPSDAKAGAGTASLSTTTTTTSEPAQATHGEPTATSYYTWILHNSSPTPIYYGTCNFYDNTCSTGGYINAYEDANTYTSGEAYFHEAIREGAGEHASFSSHQVRLFQDISGSPDSVKGNLGCSTSGYNALDCAGYLTGGNVGGNWYYFREDFRMSFGTSYTNVQIQTRRYKVVSSNNWQFIAYEYGG